MARRIKIEDARRKVQADEALFVCAYDDEEKCKAMRLQGASTLGEFNSHLSGIPKDTEIVFYCG